MLVTVLLSFLGAGALIGIGFVLCALVRSGEAEDAYSQGWHDAEEHLRLAGDVPHA